MARGLVKSNKTGITVSKRTSQGLKHAPLNKHKRRSFKKYRGQGRP